MVGVMIVNWFWSWGMMERKWWCRLINLKNCIFALKPFLKRIRTKLKKIDQLFPFIVYIALF